MLFPEMLQMIDPEPHGAALNMAIDEVLLSEVVRPTLRFYDWARSSVSFGYFGKFDEVKSVALGRAIVRRWTGGGIVEHGGDVTYTLLVPRDHAFCQNAALESYRLIHDVIAGVLLGEGMEARLVSAPADGAASACFESPVRYDLAVEGTKIAGAAQRRTRWGLLHQGSIQTQFPVPDLREKIAAAFGAVVSEQQLSDPTISAALGLAETKYGTTAWMRKF